MLRTQLETSRQSLKDVGVTFEEGSDKQGEKYITNMDEPALNLNGTCYRKTILIKQK